MDDDLRTFLVESMDTINRVEEHLLSAETDRERGLKQIVSAFGAIHSIKGNAMYLNFTALVKSCQMAEEYLSNRDRSPKVPSSEEFDRLFKFVDAVRDAFRNLEADTPIEQAHAHLSQWLKDQEYHSTALPFDTIQQGAIIGFFDVGMAKAADAFQQLTAGLTKLEVSKVRIYPGDIDFCKSGLLAPVQYTVSQQGFYCVYSGEALVMLSSYDAGRLTEALTAVAPQAPDFAVNQQETIKEIGNIVTNHIIGSVSNLLERPVDYTVPVYHERDPAGLFKGVLSQPQDNIFVLSRVTFRIKADEQDNCLVILIKIKAIGEFLSAVMAKSSPGVRKA